MSLAALALAAAAVAAPALHGPSGLPGRELRSYVPYSRLTGPELGMMDLSRTSARFERLRGAMRLSYVGPMTTSFTSELQVTGELYKVQNATAFFQLNRKRHYDCSRPVRWLYIADVDTALVTITFYTGLPDQPRPWSGDACRGDNYLVS